MLFHASVTRNYFENVIKTPGEKFQVNVHVELRCKLRSRLDIELQREQGGFVRDKIIKFSGFKESIVPLYLLDTR